MKIDSQVPGLSGVKVLLISSSQGKGLVFPKVWSSSFNRINSVVLCSLNEFSCLVHCSSNGLALMLQGFHGAFAQLRKLMHC